jgi:hypothetical protein
MEKEELDLLKAGALRGDKHCQRAGFLAKIKHDYAAMVKDEEDL